jgi:predicted nucleic acid-binding Zn ribbon protein
MLEVSNREDRKEVNPMGRDKALFICKIGRIDESNRMFWLYELNRLKFEKENKTQCKVIKQERRTILNKLQWIKMKAGQMQNINSQDTRKRWVVYHSKAGVLLLLLLNRSCAGKYSEMLQAKIESYIDEKKFTGFNEFGIYDSCSTKVVKKMIKKEGDKLARFVIRFFNKNVRNLGNVREVNQQLLNSMYFHSKFISPRKNIENTPNLKESIGDIANFDTESSMKQTHILNPCGSFIISNNLKNSFSKNCFSFISQNEQPIHDIIQNLQTSNPSSFLRVSSMETQPWPVKGLGTNNSFTDVDLTPVQDLMNISGYNQEINNCNDIKILYNSKQQLYQRRKIKSFTSLDTESSNRAELKKKQEQRSKNMKIVAFFAGGLMLIALLVLGVVLRFREF